MLLLTNYVGGRDAVYFMLLMLTFYFPSFYAEHGESLNLVVTNSLINIKGEWVPNCDDEMIVPRLGKVSDSVEDVFNSIRDASFMRRGK